MQNNNDTLKIIAKLYDTNIPYIMDETVSHVMLQGVTPCGMAILKDITDYTSSTASFLLSDNMLAVDGDLKLSIVITANSSISDNDSNQIISTFPFKIRVVHAPVGEIQESEFDSITKYVLKSEQHAKESENYGLLSQNCAVLSESYAIGGTNTRENEDNDNAKKYKDDASLSEHNAKASEEQAKASETNAFNSAADASASSDTAEQKAVEASASATNAASSAQLSETKAKEASASATDASIKAAKSADSAILSKSYAVGGTNTRENENIDNSKYYYEQSKSISESFSGSLRPMGTVSFLSLPPIASVSDGDMYNISDEFITTADFKEGSGNIIPVGSNIYKTVDGKWDILAGTPVTGVKGNSESTYRKGNVNITPENIGALPVNGNAKSAAALQVPRVTKNPSSKNDNYTLSVEEYSNSSEGLPSSHWYYIFTSQGGDQNYASQLALGMTVDDMYFRTKQGGVWRDWINISHNGNLASKVASLIAGGAYRLQAITPPVTSPSNDTTAIWGSQNCVTVNYLSAGQLKGQPNTYGLLFNISTGGSEVFQLWRSQPSGSVYHRGGNRSGWEGSAANTGSWKELLDSGNYSSYVVPKSGGTFTGTIGAGAKVALWSDGEGGNIRLVSPNSNNTYYEMDVLGGNLRIYKMTEGTYSNPFILTNDTLTVNKLSASGGITGNLTGNASTATSLTTSAGSAVQPVYFNNGKPVACTTAFATASHTHGYLPLTGGTLNGHLYLSRNYTLYMGLPSNGNQIPVLSSSEGDIFYLGRGSWENGVGRVYVMGRLLNLESKGNLVITTGQNNCFMPEVDNSTYLGGSTYRWKSLHAATGTIQTSDRNAKNNIENLSEDLISKFILSLKPVRFKFNDNESNRYHWGLISQDIEETMNALGMDSKDFAGFIKSPKTKLNDDGEEEIVKGEYTYSLRYDEFIAPIIKFLQYQQNKINEFEKQITQNQEQIAQLSDSMHKLLAKIN